MHKVSILPRGPALGYTLQLPIEDKFLTSENEILDKIVVLLSGRAAEELIFGEKTTGSHDDLKRATEIAYRIVTEYGMSEELGPITFDRDRDKIFLGREMAQGREFSEKTAQLIDEGVKGVIDKCNNRSKDILKNNRDMLKCLADALIEREIIEGDEIKRIVGIEVEEKKGKDNGSGKDKKSS